MKQVRKIFWGLMFIIGAFALLVGKMGYLEGIGFWSILVSVALLGICVDGILHRNYNVVLFSIAFLVIVNDELLGLEAITPWPVLGAALLGSIGLGILLPGKFFHGKKAQKYTEFKSSVKGGKYSDLDWDILGGEEISFSNVFGEAVKYLSGNEISQVHLKNVFGELDIYFDNAVLKNGEAYVCVENVFGETVLYVPSDWKVIKKVQTVFGNAGERGPHGQSEDKVLYVEGKVVFGELQIHYL